MKNRICENALLLFLEQGYDGAALSQIAKASGITKAGLYHYFPDKESLLYEIHKSHIANHFVPMLDEISNISDPVLRISVFIEKYTLLLTQDPAAKLFIHEARRLKPEHHKEIASIWRKAYDLISGAIEELQGLSRCKDLNSTFASFAAIGMTSWTFHWFDYSRKESGEELARTFKEIFLQGVLRAPHTES